MEQGAYLTGKSSSEGNLSSGMKNDDKLYKK